MSQNIIDLPSELIEKIFDYLPKANDRRRLAQVCRTFYKIVRGQSKKFGTLYLTETVPDKSPVQVFKNSTSFPFSKLHVDSGAPEIIQDLDFWQEHGQYITELTIKDHFPFHWLTCFPDLKKLKLDQFSKLLIEENAPKIQLPVEELCIEFTFNMDEICFILQCCPSLKSVELPMYGDHLKRCAELLPWIESTETVKMDFGAVQLKDILELPSKVLLQHLPISADTNVETIASFFNKPRFIETLKLNFDLYENEFNSLFTKDKVLPLLKAESIKQLVLYNYIPEFPGSLDLLAQLPGLQEIHIVFKNEIVSLPCYWSSPNTASKIHNIKFLYQFNPEVLFGLSSLSSLTIGICNGNLGVVRNHPKLKELAIDIFYYGDAELEPISSLRDLEILHLHKAPKVTSAAFKTLIRFPKLKKFFIYSEEMNNDVAMLLPENCPNLEELYLVYAIYNVDHVKDSLNDSGFEHLIRALPYLKQITISGNGLTISQEKVQQMQMEFPYLEINI